jgi:thiol-disulfide isomerase/thioredoxin
MLNSLRILSVLGLISSGFALAAAPAAIPDLAVQFQGGSVELTPPKGHHFNAQAPAQLVIQESSRKLESNLTEKTFKAALPLESAGKELAAQVFVCDDAKTFCLKKKQTLRVPAGAVTTSANEKASPSKDAASAPIVSRGKPAPPHTENDTGFIVNDPDKAFKLAAQKKLPLMIDFFGIWCPPCNHLDAMVFRSAEFKKHNAKRFVHLKLDSDQERFNALKNRYKIQGLPTVVFTTATGDEIFRLVGFHPLDVMLQKADAAYASREVGFAELMARAGNGGNAEASFQAAKIALDRDEPEKALEWLAPMKELFTKTGDPRLEQFYRAELGVAQAKGDKSETRKVLKQWLKDFPSSIDSIDNYQTLADLEEQAGNKDTSRETLLQAVTVTEKFLATPNLLAGSSYTPADVTESRADIYEKLGDATRTRNAYQACADAFIQEARVEGTPFARGPNLEAAYCLGKAGKIQESEAIYREGIRRFPQEYTFHAGLAKLWLDAAKQPKRALEAIDPALAYAYGNQRLKAVLIKAKAYEALGEFKDGVAVLNQELSVPASAQVSPGTTKLRERMTAKRDELQKKTVQ